MIIIRRTQIKAITKIEKGEREWRKKVGGGLSMLISLYFLLWSC